MNKKLVLVFVLNSIFIFSQKKVSKIFQTTSNEINIYTAGLDNLVLENSTSDFVEVYLVAESYDSQLIKIEDKNKQVNIKFDFEGTETREVIFRKYITKRLQRANAVVKVPKGKKVFIFGENIDIESKNHQNELAIYIENGIVKLNKIGANTILKLYSGNVYAAAKNINIYVKSSLGKIEVDDKIYKKEFIQNFENHQHKLKIITSKGNVFLKTKPN